LNNTEIYCPFCGAKQEKGAKFCPSCGAALESLNSEAPEEVKVKVIKETPLAESSVAIQTTAPQPTAYSPAATNAYYSTTPSKPQAAGKDNAMIALILGLATLVVNCFILPIIGLVFVKKAEENNEDHQLIVAARVVNWIFLALYLLGLIGLIIYFVLYFAMGFYYI